MSTLSFNLDRHQTRFFQSFLPGRICTNIWGRGTGKTLALRAMIHALALASPGIHIGILYPSLKQARAILWEGVQGLFADYSALVTGGQVRRYHRSELTAEYANMARVSTWGAENAKSMRGQRFDVLLQDESDDIDPEMERSVVQPTFSRSGTMARWGRFGTPLRGRYGTLYAGFEQAEEQSKGYFRGPDGKLEFSPDATRTHWAQRVRSDESPQVDQRWLAGVRADLYAKGKGAVYEREYNCSFDASEGLVYPGFNPDTHVREADAEFPWSEIIVGVDHGWNDPGVILPAGVVGNGQDAVIHGLEEIYQTGKDTSWWGARAAEVAGRYKAFRQRWYADPSRPDRIEDIRRAVKREHPDLSGFSIQAADNAIEAGVDAVADRLSIRVGCEVPRLFFSPKCANTIAEFGKYRRKRDPKNTERVLDDIVDKDNHSMDCVRYQIVSRFGRPDNVASVYDPYGGNS